MLYLNEKSSFLKDLADSGKNEESSDDDEGNEDSESKLGKNSKVHF